jgi:hypothetical protein
VKIKDKDVFIVDRIAARFDLIARKFSLARELEHLIFEGQGFRIAGQIVSSKADSNQLHTRGI